MIVEKKGYSYNDLTIIPEVISNISSRSQCEVLNEDNMLPIFASPMTSVVGCNNLQIFKDNKITPILPRSVDIETRKKYMLCGEWVALSLKQFEEIFISDASRLYSGSQYVYKVCVDIANGHMKSLYKKCIKAKELSVQYGYKLVIMTGNIANPDTYKYICTRAIYLNDEIHEYLPAIDYIRVGIGGGSGCFIDGTKIKTINGEKNIEDIKEGDKVLTIDNTYQNVIGTTRFKSNELLKINNEITCTKNHKFFVINKSDKNKVNDNNLQKYGYWIEANKLDKNIHLLVKLE